MTVPAAVIVPVSAPGPYQVHPFADVFPLVAGDEFQQLVADIKLNGLRDPIILSAHRTVLIDGRGCPALKR